MSGAGIAMIQGSVFKVGCPIRKCDVLYSLRLPIKLRPLDMSTEF